MKKIFLLLLSCALFVSCSSDSESDISENTGNENPTNETKLTYAADIAPTINGRCLNCHGNSVRNGASVSLTSESLVKANGSDILNRITTGNMPRGGAKLSASYISNFGAWLNQD